MKKKTPKQKRVNKGVSPESPNPRGDAWNRILECWEIVVSLRDAQLAALDLLEAAMHEYHRVEKGIGT